MATGDEPLELTEEIRELRQGRWQERGDEHLTPRHREQRRLAGQMRTVIDRLDADAAEIAWADSEKPRLPHARGGEPWDQLRWLRNDFVFPTHVGVNRSPSPRRSRPRQSSPRTWG